MKKTLLISIEDSEKLEHLTIAGTLNPNEFNPNVVVSVGGQFKIQLSSQDLALALKQIVDFQTPVKITSYDG